MINDAYCINIENNALTRYEDFPFTGFCKFDGKYYGIKPDGIYLLDSADEDDELKQEVLTGYINIANSETKSQKFSSLRQKQTRGIDGEILMRNSEQMTMTIFDDSKNDYEYDFTENYDNEKCKFRIGGGVRTSKYQFKFETLGDFKLYNLALNPRVMDRGV